MRVTIVTIFMVVLAACNTQSPVASDELVMPDSGQIGVYYFRTSLRCETCDAIEQIVKEELGGRYADNVKTGKIVFRQFNLDDPGVADFALGFNVVFKSVIIFKDDQRINLTNDAFLYALPEPEKLKEIFESTLDKL